MGFSRREYWSGLPLPTPGDLPYPGIKPISLVSPALADGFFTTVTTWEAQYFDYVVFKSLYVLGMHTKVFMLKVIGRFQE